MGVESYFHYLIVFLLYGTLTTSEKFPVCRSKTGAFSERILGNCVKEVGGFIEELNKWKNLMNGRTL